MSGPKINNYSLSPQARKNLNEQILCERQSIFCAEEIRKLLLELLGFRDSANEELAKMQLLQNHGGQCDAALAALSDYLDRFEQETEGFFSRLKSEKPAMSASYTPTDAELHKKKKQLKHLQELKRSVQRYSEPLRQMLSECRSEQESRTLQLHNAVASEIDPEVSFAFSPVSAADILEQKKQAAAERFNGLLTAPDCPPSMTEPLQNALNALHRIHSPEQFSTFCSITADPLEKRFKKAIKTIAAEKARKAELTDRFVFLCKHTDSGLQNIPDDLEVLQREVETMEQKLAALKEQEYIAACLDEVMTEMGYDLIGCREVTKNSGKRFRNELYTFHEGTAVNVTYSSDGQIAMELGGISASDRLPTPEETDLLVSEMEAFCGDFEEIERRLSQKGVVHKSRIAMLPPAAEYASIINVGDYTVEEGKTVSELQTVYGRKKAAAEKTLHRRND